MASPEMARNRIYSTTSYSSWLTSVSAGYFLYDVFICAVRFEGLAYLMHGAFCFAGQPTAHPWLQGCSVCYNVHE